MSNQNKLSTETQGLVEKLNNIKGVSGVRAYTEKEFNALPNEVLTPAQRRMKMQAVG